MENPDEGTQRHHMENSDDGTERKMAVVHHAHCGKKNGQSVKGKGQETKRLNKVTFPRNSDMQSVEEKGKVEPKSLQAAEFLQTIGGRKGRS
jgi:hypothetical protein